MKHFVKEVDSKLLNVSGNAFSEAELIPAKYTCDGIDINPPIDISKIPEVAVSLAIIADDPDAPGKHGLIV